MQTSEGTWLESITLFEQIREGNYEEAFSLLDSSSDPATALYGLGRLFHCFFNTVDGHVIEAFAETARKMPPPCIPPSLTHAPSISELASSYIALIADENRVHHEPELAVINNHTLQLPPSSQLVAESYSGTEVEVIFVDPCNQESSYRFPGHLTTEGIIILRGQH